MNEIMELIIIAAVAVAGFTVIYKIVPFKTHGTTKPKFVLFPKYIANFEKPIEDIESALRSLSFKEIDDGKYTRGKVYGDFSAKAIKLAVELDKNEKHLTVYASFFGILFDTGDIWQVTVDILNTNCSDG